MKKRRMITLTATLTLCVCACFALAFGAGARADGAELQLYSDEELTTLYEKVDGVYQIPVQADIYIPVDARGKTSAVLAMGDQEYKQTDLSEYENWQDQPMTVNVWYDNSCALNGVSSYTMRLILDGETTATAAVCAVTNGTLEIGNWPLPLYYETSGEGNALLTTESADNRTQVTRETGFSIASGRRLFIWDIPSLDPGCHWIWAGLVRADSSGNPLWWDAELGNGTFSAADLEDGRVELSTAGIAPGTPCLLRFSTGGMGYDQVFIDFPVTIEAPRMTFNEEYQAAGVSRNDDGSVTVPLNLLSNFGVFMQGADSATIYCAETENADPDSAEVYHVAGLDSGYGGFFYTPTDFNVAFPENAQSVTRYLFFTAQSGDQLIRSQDMTVVIPRPDTISGTFHFDQTAGTVARDGIFAREISFAPSDGKDIDYLGMYIQGQDGKWIADSHWIPAGNNQATVTMPPLECAPGEYQVHVCAIRFGASQLVAADTIPLTVTAPETDDPILISVKNPSVTMEALPIYVHYTNPENLALDRIEVRIYDSNHEEILTDFTTETTYWNDWMTFDWVGSYSLEAEVYPQGSDTPAATRTFTLEVEAEGQVGILDPSPALPSYLPEGSALSFTVPVPEYAEKYNIDVWYDTDQGMTTLRTDYERTAPETETLTAEELPPAGTMLHIRVYGCGYNVNADARQWDVLIIPAAEDTDTGITLTVNGDTADQTILSSENVAVHVAYPAERPTVVRIWDGGGMDYLRGDMESFDRDWMFGGGTVVLYAQATWDEIDFEGLDATEWADFDWNTSVAWTGISNVITLQVSNAYGSMCMPSYTVENQELQDGGSGVLSWGSDLMVTFTDPAPMGIPAEGGDPVPVSDGWFNLNLEAERADENGSWWEGTGVYYAIHSGLNYIPTYNLEPGRYQVVIGANAPGYEGTGDEAFIFEVGPRADESQSPVRSFEVNGQTGALAVPAATELSLAAYYSGAGWYDVMITRADNPDWEDHRSQCENGMLLDSWRSDSEGVFTLTAYAYGPLYDGDGNPTTDEAGNDFWEEQIGSVTVTATADNGDLGNPDAALPDRVTLGAMMTIHFNAVENAEEYSYWIHRAEDNAWLAGGSRRSPGDLMLDTGRLPETGVYWVELDTFAAGYNQGHTTLHFALVDDNDVDCSTDTFYFTISATTLETEVPARMVAYVPGAEAVRLYSRWDNETMEECYASDGPGVGFWFGSGRAGTYQFYLSWSAGGNWTEPLLVSDAALTYTSVDQLPVPRVSINGDDTDAPAVPAREDGRLVLSLTKGNADGYYISLHPFNDGREIFGQDIDPEEYTDDLISFEIDDLVPGQAYDVICDAHKQGWTQATFCRSFVLQPASAGGMTLSVQAADEDGFWTGEEVLVSARATGATAIHIRLGNGEDRWYRGDTLEAERWTIWDVQNLFYAYATTDPIPENDDFDWNELNVSWSLQSSPVAVTAQTEGATLVPSVEVPESVVKGEWLSFTIHEDGDARQMDVYISDDEGNDYEFRRLFRTGAWQLPTSNLEIGRTYRLRLCCVQSRHLWAVGPDYCFTVTAPQEDTAFLRVDRTTLYQGEHFVPAVYAPGAEKVRIDIDGASWGEWDGNYGTSHADWEWSLTDAGEHIMRAYALYEHENDWTEIGDTIVLTVVDPYQASSRLTLPAGLREIEEEAFAGTSAYAVIIPDGVTTIGSRAFAGSGIQLLVIPDSVVSIASDAFADTPLWVVYGGSVAERLANACGAAYCGIY
ncbi:MAG: leucine-rich repeat protein [Clostridia bacterium]|nr:leucine-rich repeat protein [Clostridia bacterium]